MAVPSRSAWRPGCSQRWAGCPPSRRSCRLPEQPPRPQQPSAMTGPGYPAARVWTPRPPRSRSPSGPCRRSIPGPLRQPRGADGALPPNACQMVSLLTCRRGAHLSPHSDSRVKWAHAERDFAEQAGLSPARAPSEPRGRRPWRTRRGRARERHGDRCRRPHAARLVREERRRGIAGLS